MKNNHLFIKPKGLVSFLLVIIIILGLSIITSYTAYADNTAVEIGSLSPEDYTLSDSLLNKDGTKFDQTIQEFATHVNNQAIDGLILNIDKVIPIEYLESTENNANYQHNGLEYGFYLSKTAEYFDLLLIDFEYIKLDNYQYSMYVSPILQVSFQRVYSAGEYSYVKISNESRNKYYVANPSFMTVVLNENELNYGDNGYSKADDGGMIIRQSRFNYGSMLYKDTTDLVVECANYVSNAIFDAAVDKSLKQFPDHPMENYRESWLAPRFSGAECFERFNDENR